MALNLRDKVVKSDDDTVFHSNSFASFANGNRVGAVSSETFEQRKRREKQRKVIAGYQTSNIGRPFAATNQSGPALSRSLSNFSPPPSVRPR